MIMFTSIVREMEDQSFGFREKFIKLDEPSMADVVEIAGQLMHGIETTEDPTHETLWMICNFDHKLTYFKPKNVDACWDVAEDVLKACGCDALLEISQTSDEDAKNKLIKVMDVHEFDFTIVNNIKYEIGLDMIESGVKTGTIRDEHQQHPVKVGDMLIHCDTDLKERCRNTCTIITPITVESDCIIIYEDVDTASLEACVNCESRVVLKGVYLESFAKKDGFCDFAAMKAYHFFAKRFGDTLFWIQWS